MEPTAPSAAWLPAWDGASVAAHAACYGAALALTLVLAAWFTPRRWWRRPNLQALSVLAVGTLGFGALLFPLLSAALPDAAPRAVSRPQAEAAHAAAPLNERPAAGAVFLAIDTLNLRSGTGIGERRLAVLPPGSRVVATGAARGDWWQVRAQADGRPVEGWTSSLWLRRPGESARAGGRVR